MIDIDYELTNRYFTPTLTPTKPESNGCGTFIACLILGFIGFAAITASVELFLQDKDFGAGIFTLLITIGLLAFPFFQDKKFNF